MLEPVFKKIIGFFKVNTECYSFHLFQTIRTFFLVCIGFVFFRASSAGTAVRMIRAALYPNVWVFTDGSLLKLGLDTPDFVIGFVSLGILLLASLLQQKFHAEHKTVRGVLSCQNLPFRWFMYYGLIFAILIFGFYGPGYDASEFIYENF